MEFHNETLDKKKNDNTQIQKLFDVNDIFIENDMDIATSLMTFFEVGRDKAKNLNVIPTETTLNSDHSLHILFFLILLRSKKY